MREKPELFPRLGFYQQQYIFPKTLAGNFIYHHKQLLWQATSGLGVFYQTLLQNVFLTQTLRYQRARNKERKRTLLLILYNFPLNIPARVFLLTLDSKYFI